MSGELIHGDCLDVMREMDAGSVDLIMTSPPYGNQRKRTYGGIDPDQYVDWFLPRAAEMQRVLRPTGSFVLNIKENVVDGERHPYVLHLTLALREQGWRWVEEYVWRKTSSFPIRVTSRFRDGWEKLLHFTKAKDFKFNANNVRVPLKESSLQKGQLLATREPEHLESMTGSGFVIKRGFLIGAETCYPDNVIESSSESHNMGHPAVFPKKIPAFFVKLFTDAGDVVLDPFCGSGTTMAAAQSLGRQWIGIDKDQLSIDISRDRLAKTQPALIAA